MARNRARKAAAAPAPAPGAADDVRPADGFVPTAEFRESEGFAPIKAPEVRAPAPPADRDPRDAEILRLREELAALKGASAALSGGKFTIAWKDGPTLTVEARAGESPADALSRHGVHSTPHKLEVHPAPDDAVCGQHLPNGSVRPFVREK